MLFRAKPRNLSQWLAVAAPVTQPGHALLRGSLASRQGFEIPHYVRNDSRGGRRYEYLCEQALVDSGHTFQDNPRQLAVSLIPDQVRKPGDWPFGRAIFRATTVPFFGHPPRQSHFVTKGGRAEDSLWPA